MSLLTDALERRSSLENPNTPLTGERLLNFFGGEPTDAGVRVTETGSLNLSVVFACIRAISETLAGLPVHLYRRLPKGREHADRHEVDFLLREPNPEMTGMVFWETLISHAVARRGGFAEVERHRDGTPAALWPLLPPTALKGARDDHFDLSILREP